MNTTEFHVKRPVILSLLKCYALFVNGLCRISRFYSFINPHRHSTLSILLSSHNVVYMWVYALEDYLRDQSNSLNNGVCISRLATRGADSRSLLHAFHSNYIVIHFNELTKVIITTGQHRGN